MDVPRKFKMLPRARQNIRRLYRAAFAGQQHVTAVGIHQATSPAGYRVLLVVTAHRQLLPAGPLVGHRPDAGRRGPSAQDTPAPSPRTRYLSSTTSPAPAPRMQAASSTVIHAARFGPPAPPLSGPPTRLFLAHSRFSPLFFFLLPPLLLISRLAYSRQLQPLLHHPHQTPPPGRRRTNP